MDELAKSAYDIIAGLDPESAKVVAGMIVNEGFHYDLGDLDISKAYLEHQSQGLEDMKNQIVRSFVSKRMAGEGVESLVALADAISKADYKPKRGGNKKNRGQFSRVAGDGAPGKAFHVTDNSENQNAIVGARRSSVDTVGALIRPAQESFGRGPGNRFNGQVDTQTFVPGVARARRVGQAADYLNMTVGGYTPGAAQVGLSLTGVMGEHASQAQAAFGPSIDRAKYRYKGTERKLDDRLKGAVSADRRKYGKEFSAGVALGSDEPGIRRVQSSRSTGGSMRGTRVQWQPSETVAYFQNHLPSERMAGLQRFAGHQPPSEGIIIAHDGKVGAQMVGSGDDHYLPFNLNNLGSLKGGSYVRTRTHGGLTTEDVYTGLMAGAKQMTVVSHNGVYTMAFDDTLRGSRRYSQTARDMTQRYGQLLDAVKNGNVTVHPLSEVDPARDYELRDQADGDIDEYQALLANNTRRPMPSAEIQRQWGGEFLDSMADGVTTKDGLPMSPDDYIEQRVIPAMKAQTMRNSMISGGDSYAMDPYTENSFCQRNQQRNKP